MSQVSSTTTSDNHESSTIAQAAAEAFGRGGEAGVDRLAAAIAHRAPVARKCLECGELTTGSVGAAGLRWPALCQPCKDKADGCLSYRIKAAGSISASLLAAIDQGTKHEQTRAEFLADFEAKTKLEIHPFTPNRDKWTDEQREIADADHDDLAPRFSDEDEEDTEE